MSSNLPVRNNDYRNAYAGTVEQHPFRLVRRMLNWDPFSEMTPFSTEGRNSLGVAFEVKESKVGYIFKADVPGVKEADIDITVTGNHLTVTGKREAERQDENDRFYAYERSFGTFTRAFTLPESADTSTVQAELKDGVLTIAVNRKAEMQPQKVQIKPQTAKS